MNIQLTPITTDTTAPQYYIGCSGWHYDHWRSLFYPLELPKPEWLRFYAKQFNTVELNSSFYQLPSEKTFKRWRESTPDSFIFAVKVSRFITHIKRLRNSEIALKNFLSRAAILQNKLGPILYQLPPSMKRNDEMLCEFLALLPRCYRHVFEFRHESWLNASIFNILRRYNIGLCVFDMPDIDCPLITTSDVAYVRFHGSQKLYSSRYSDKELSQWSQDIIQLGKNVKAIYVYFNNDVEAFAIRNALTLRNYLHR